MSASGASEKSNRYQSVNERTLMLLSFVIGATLAAASAERGANCQAGFHFLTIFVWVRVFGQSLAPISIRSLDAILNGVILAILAWVALRATQPLSKTLRLSGLVVLNILYALLMFVAFPMKDCL